MLRLLSGPRHARIVRFLLRMLANVGISVLPTAGRPNFRTTWMAVAGGNDAGYIRYDCARGVVPTSHGAEASNSRVAATRSQYRRRAPDCRFTPPTI